MAESEKLTRNDVEVLGRVPLTPPPERRVVEAVGSAVGMQGQGKDRSRAQFIEAAMVAAIKLCSSQGVTDPDVIRAAQLKAKDWAVQRLNEATG